MPSSATITAFYSFSAGHRARSSFVNANFNLFRGHLVPIDPNTATATDNTYDLGSDEHRWRTAYVQSVDIETSTSTASLTISGDASTATGAFLFKIEGTTKARINSNGFVGSDVSALPNTSLQTSTAYPSFYAQTFTANGTWTCPAWATHAIFDMYGAGGGGGAGANDPGGGAGGGGGGSGAHRIIHLAVSAGFEYSITVASAGGAGATGGTSTIVQSGLGQTWRCMGGNPGGAASGTTAGAGAKAVPGGAYGGDGGAGGGANAGQTGGYGEGAYPGAGGAGSSGCAGGGGGGGGFGLDGAGGGGGTTAGANGSTGSLYGSGGGGGAGNNGAAGGTGGSGRQGFITIMWARPTAG